MKGLAAVGVVLGARGAHGLRAERRIAAARGSHAARIVERRDVEGLGTPLAVGAMAVAEVRDEPPSPRLKLSYSIPTPLCVSQSTPITAYVMGYLALNRTTLELNGVIPTGSRPTNCPFT